MRSYLDLMGIEQWTLRQQSAPMLPACYAYELLHQGQPVGLLLATATVEEAAVTQLLAKMIAALKCQPQGQWYPAQPEFSDLSHFKFVITLGEGFEVPEGVRHIPSYSPQRLISEPKLKAETWKDLQVVLTLLQ
ncbi:MAG: hypothetical protein KDH94_07675 [Coxiellaceae bacterium]|nr:hypothetical protein [Coxiellaceae bacterium]